MSTGRRDVLSNSVERALQLLHVCFQRGAVLLQGMPTVLTRFVQLAPAQRLGLKGRDRKCTHLTMSAHTAISTHRKLYNIHNVVECTTTMVL